MIRITLICFCLFLSNFIFAQGSWAEEGKTWFYNLTTYPGSDDEYVKLKVGRDTVVNGEGAFVLKNEMVSANDINPIFAEDIVFQVKDHRVSRLVDGRFRLLYDFNLVLGDTIKIYVNFSDDPVNAGMLMMRVDSLKTINIGEQEVAAQFLTPLNDIASFSGWKYEYIGDIGTYFLPVPSLGCWGACPVGLTCYTSDAGSLDIESFDTRTCMDFISNVRGITNVSAQLTLYPNPVDGARELTVSVPTTHAAQAAEVMIYNNLGQTVFKQALPAGSAEFKLALPKLPAGIFYLKWFTTEVRAVKPIVISAKQ